MPNQRLIRKLAEQLRFLEASAANYDTGLDIEAIRIAGSLRALFHKTPNSTPLVTLLKMENWQMLTTSKTSDHVHAFIAQRVDLTSATPVKPLPRLGSQFSALALVQWWSVQSIFGCKIVDPQTKQPKSQHICRKDLVLCAANRDGYAHVGPLDEFYRQLEDGVGLLSITGNLKYHGSPPFEQGIPQQGRNTHFALLRQFGHEVLQSARHFKWIEQLNERA